MKMKKCFANKKGFTLVEVLTVLVIIGIVLVITIPNVSKLMHNENDKKLDTLINIALKASNIYIDTYKKSFVDMYDKYNFKYESLLVLNLVKEEDIHCTGTMQATRKKGNNYTYDAYLICKDSKGNVIHDNIGDLPEGGVSIFGKFIIDYQVKLNNRNGNIYNHDYTKENVYNEYVAYDLERSGTTSGINKFMYSYNNRDWLELKADETTGEASFTLTNTYVGKVYFKAYDLVGNESEVLDYEVKIDKIAPSGILKLDSVDSRYNTLNVKANLSASDNESGSGVKSMCIQESSDVHKCNWINYSTSYNFTLSGVLDGLPRRVYAWFRDKVGNVSLVSGGNKNATYTPYKDGNEVVYPNGFGACSVACGGGLQTNEARDKYTNNKIPGKNQYKECNTRGCCSSTTITGYSACSKTCGGGVKNVYRKSNYNNQSCTVASETVACNKQSCSPTIIRVGDDIRYRKSASVLVPLNTSNFVYLQWDSDFTWGGRYPSYNMSTTNYSKLSGKVITVNDLSVSTGPLRVIKEGLQTFANGGGDAVRIDNNTIVYCGANHRGERSADWGCMYLKIDGTNFTYGNPFNFNTGGGIYWSGMAGLDYTRGNSYVRMFLGTDTKTYNRHCLWTYNIYGKNNTSKNCSKRRKYNYVKNAVFDKEGIVGTTGVSRYREYETRLGLSDGRAIHLCIDNKNSDDISTRAGVYSNACLNRYLLIDKDEWEGYGTAKTIGHMGDDKLVVATVVTYRDKGDKHYYWYYQWYLHFFRYIGSSWQKTYTYTMPTIESNSSYSFVTLNSNTLVLNTDKGFYLIRYD